MTDQGVGISESDQKKLFERFYRVENEEVANIAGFGIGLYIVAEILRLHNSEMVVESEKGVGTIFKFYLDQYQDETPLFTNALTSNFTKNSTM